MSPKVYCIVFILLGANVLAQPDAYLYKRKLAPVAKEDYYSVPLQPEITAHCKNNLNDLRLYNAGAKDTVEIPYIVEWQGDKTEQTIVPFELINDVTHLKCCSYLTLKPAKKMVINRIDLGVTETNFDKMLSIEGSNDNKEWFTIKEHLRITAFQNAEARFRSTELHFPSAQYSYFRIKFDDDGSDKISVNSAAAYEIKTTKGNYNLLPATLKPQPENKKEKTSELMVELPADYMLSYFTIKSSSKIDFYRDINIYKSNGIFHSPKKDEEIWEQIGSGTITSGEENSFSLNNLQVKKLKIEILNRDNQPIALDDIKIYSEKTALLAKLPASDHLYLVYGNENATAPVYDLVHFKEKIPAALSTISYGEEELKTQPAAVITEPLVNNKKWLWIVMGIVILGIGYFSLNMLRKE